MNPKHSVPSSRRTDAGFTLIELLVSLAVTAVLILGVLATFDFSARMNKVQLNVADMQQSLRIAQNEVVRLSRMTGRGSLPTNIAVQVANNLPAGSKLVDKENGTVALRSVTIARWRDETAAIASGVKDGELIATAGVHKLEAGQKVKPMPTQLQAAR